MFFFTKRSDDRRPDHGAGRVSASDITSNIKSPLKNKTFGGGGGCGCVGGRKTPAKKGGVGSPPRQKKVSCRLVVCGPSRPPKVPGMVGDELRGLY